RDNFQVDFNGIKTFMLDFVFRERERKINFGTSGIDEESQISDEDYFKQIRENFGEEPKSTTLNQQQINNPQSNINTSPVEPNSAPQPSAPQNTTAPAQGSTQ
ncbi:hypothetical protein RZS08_53725, partial [Arthrospira platensis SPKY1]|nr:hypothetical protein [Arthrospira platensis SPKY1]